MRKQRRTDPMESPFETNGQSMPCSDVTQKETIKPTKCGKPLQMATMGLLEEYCRSSTVHGVKYIGEKKRHWIERVWWIFAFALTLYGCGTLIQNVYMKWDQSPVIVSFAVKSTPIWEIPFPAVTICPETKTNTSLLNFTKIYNIMGDSPGPPYNITNDEEELMGAVAQVCNVPLSVDTEENFANSSIIGLLRRTAPFLNDSMIDCDFRESHECDMFFHEIMTDEGLCFTFNALNGSELYTEELSPDYVQLNHGFLTSGWSLENGYNVSIRNDYLTYPFRAYESGINSGLGAFLNLYEKDLDYLCRNAIVGFKVLLHAPGEIPQVSKRYIRVPLDQEVEISVKPKMITTSDGLKEYEPHRKQCYFQSERKLRFIKVYTQSNCELECLANITLRVCGCVKFSMPRDKDAAICGVAKTKCYNDVKRKWMHYKLDESLYKTDEENFKGCNCLPACSSITYDADISQTPFDFKRVLMALGIPLQFFDGRRPVRVSVFFKDDHFSTSRRSELYSFSEFVANCGGLVGLFVGASFLSVVELLYYFSLRLCCNLRAIVHRQRKIVVADEPIGDGEKGDNLRF